MLSMAFESTSEGLKISDIEPRVPPLGGTKIVIQRHGEYDRSEESAKPGSLTEEASKSVQEHAQKFVNQLLATLPPEERDTVDFLVLASDTRFRDRQDYGQRSMETAQAVVSGIKEVLQAIESSDDHLLNTSGKFHGSGGPRPTKQIREPKVFRDSPEFVKFLEAHYGKDKDFWVAFESDQEEKKREEMGAEGPWEMAERLAHYVDVLARFSRDYHERNPGRRLVVWAVSHYDLLSPYAKRYLSGLSKTDYLPVDYGAGISIDVDSSGKATTTFGGTQIKVPGRYFNNSTD